MHFYEEARARSGWIESPALCGALRFRTSAALGHRPPVGSGAGGSSMPGLDKVHRRPADAGSLGQVRIGW
jgi:hypothetical protein